MDVVQSILRILELRDIAKARFGDEAASAIEDMADKWAEKSTLSFLDSFTLAIQIETEFPGRSEHYFDEAQLWVHRTAEEHHPHNRMLYLKAMVWTLEKWRHERGESN